MDNFISIDFGTTACRTAYDKDGSFELIPNRYSDGRIPLLIERTKGQSLLFNLSSIKQKIGFEEEVTIDGKKSRVIDLAADMFRGIRDDAKTNIGESPDNAVITVPAGLSEKQRAAIRTAAEKAGFTFVKLLDESAALILGAGIKDEGKVFMVYSLGGGFFTVSVFKISNSLPKALCHEGDRNLGGYNFDLSLIHHLYNISRSGFARSSPKFTSINKLKSLVEHLKIGLSKREQIEIDLDFNDYVDMGLENNVSNKFKHVLCRLDFEKIISTDVEKTFLLSKKAIQGAGVTIGDIESIMLVGGSTKIPLVERTVTDQFNKKIVRFSNEAILRGANIYGKELPNPPMPIEKDDNRIEPGEEPVKYSDKIKSRSETISLKDTEMTWLKELSPYIAQELWKKGKHIDAIEHLEKLYQELPKFIGNLSFRRGEMFLQLNNFDQAMLSFEAALRYIKDDKDVRQAYHKACSSKGRLLEKKGSLHEAAIIIKKGLAIEPKCSSCKDLLRNIEDALRNKQNAGLRGFRSKKKRR